MTELRVTDRYIKSVRQVTSARLRNRLEDLVALIEQVPSVGSTLNRPWLQGEFGNRCLTLELKPFLLVYEYDEEADVAALYGIVHQRQVR